MTDAKKQAGLGFGRVFTDHVVIARWTETGGWGPHEVVPRQHLSLDPAAAVLHYGQALFDGLKAYRGDDGKLRVFRLTDHVQRMFEGGERLAMPGVDVAALRRSILELLKVDGHATPSAADGSMYIRPFVFADEPFLGVRPAASYLLVVLLSPVGSYYDADARALRLWVEREHVRAAPGGLGAVKAAANYVASLAAATRAKRRGFDQVLWLDAIERRYLEEVGTMNLFVQLGDTVVTPALDGTILGGITRASSLALLRQAGHVVEERRISLDELETASKDGRLRGVFGTGTAAVVAPVGVLGLDEHVMEIPVGRDVAPWLLETLTAIHLGRREAPAGWIDVVG